MENSNQLNEILGHLLKDNEAYAKASQACTDYMNRKLGCTRKILNYVDEYLEEE